MPAETSFAICSMIFGGFCLYYMFFNIFKGIFERLPNLRVCFAHGGGSFPVLPRLDIMKYGFCLYV